MSDLTDVGLRDRIIQEFFADFQAEALVLVRQKTLSKEDCSRVVSAFARIATDKWLALRDAARAEQQEADAKIIDRRALGHQWQVDHGAGPLESVRQIECEFGAAAIRAQGETR